MSAAMMGERDFKRSELRQGRCLTCGIRHCWPIKSGPAKLEGARCPTCGYELYRTARSRGGFTPNSKFWPEGLPHVGDSPSLDFVNNRGE